MSGLWWVHPARAPSPRARLLCFPHAGGAASSYHGWSSHVPTDIELRAAELPGHGARFGEPPFTEFEALLEALDAHSEPLRDGTTVLFGHSLGALLAFELARRGPPPRALVVAGCPAPHVRAERSGRSRLPDAQLIEELREMAGTPDEALDNPELMEIMLPIVRSAFAVAESYQYRPGAPLECPIVALGGDADPEVAVAELEAWSQLTDAPFRCQVFSGGHFFLTEHAPEVVRCALQWPL